MTEGGERGGGRRIRHGVPTNDRWYHIAAMPPSTKSSEPVVKLLSSEAR